MSVESRVAELPRRLPAIALVAAAIGLALFSTTDATWFRVQGVELGLLRSGDGASVMLGNFAVNIVLALALLYFLARLFAAGLLLTLGGPLGAGWHLSWRHGLQRVVRVAWFTPRRAHVQGLIVLAIVVVALAMPLQLSVPGIDLEHVVIERALGGWLLVASLVLAQVAFFVIARDPLLAATQVWPTEVDDTPAEVKPARAAKPAKLPSARIERDRGRAPVVIGPPVQLVAPERVTSTANDSSTPPKFLT
jgi:hypothetical protein